VPLHETVPSSRQRGRAIAGGSPSTIASKRLALAELALPTNR
ncbi:MAG: hypothetical protein ACI814_001778, partial [Mariniblastus sp.]